MQHITSSGQVGEWLVREWAHSSANIQVILQMNICALCTFHKWAYGWSHSSASICCVVTRWYEYGALQHTATHCNTLQHTATHCNTLRHTATRCNTLQHTCRSHVDMSTVDKWDSLRSLIRVSRHTNEGSVGSLQCMQVSFECVRLFWVCKALLSVWVFFECVGLVCVVVTHWFVTHWYVTHWYVTHWYVTHCNVSRRTNEGSVGNETHNVAWMRYVT